MALVKVARDGQVALPAEARRALDIAEGGYLEAEVVGRTVVLRPAPAALDHAEAWRRIREAQASVRPTPEQAAKPVEQQEQEIFEIVEAVRHGRHG